LATVCNLRHLSPGIPAFRALRRERRQLGQGLEEEGRPSNGIHVLWKTGPRARTARLAEQLDGRLPSGWHVKSNLEWNQLIIMFNYCRVD
jgi:hypothetical protein